MKQQCRTGLHMGCGESLHSRCRAIKKLLEARRRAAVIKSARPAGNPGRGGDRGKE